MNLHNIYSKKTILLKYELLKNRLYECIQKNPKTWDCLIYIGCGIIIIWLIWAIIRGRKVKTKETISVPEVKKATWNIRKKLPTITNSKRYIARLNFLHKRIEKEKEVIKASGELMEARIKKEFLEEAQKELDRRKK